MRIAAPPPVQIVELFPWLDEFGAAAVRLHPRPSDRCLPAHASKMGGLFLWPSETRWPICHARDAEELFDFSRPENVAQLSRFLEHTYETMESFNPGGRRSTEAARRRWIAQHVEELHMLERQRRVGHNRPYIPLLQLRRDQYTALPFPGNTNLFQLLLCPHVHFYGPPREEPGFLVFWRNEDEVDEPLLQEPAFVDGLGIRECSLSPELVRELPQSKVFEPHFKQDLDNLLEELARGAAPPQLRWSVSGSDLYDDALSVAPGTKLFGYPRWVQEPQNPTCSCGRRMALLVTVAAHEAATGLGAGRWNESDPPDSPLEVSLGDRGVFYLFYCPTCPGVIMRAVVQEYWPH